MLKIIVKKGEDAGKVFELSDGIYTIGRGKDNSIHISAPSLSKEHARITVIGNRVELEDLNSSNGTFVNGALVKNYHLKHGDKINLHESTLELVSTEIPSSSFPLRSASGISSGRSLAFSLLAPDDVNRSQLNSDHNFRQNTGQRSIFKKIDFIIKEHILPLFYKMIETIEWKYTFAILFFAFATLTVVLTVAPLSTQSKRFLQTEARNQAQFITKQLAEENRRGIYLKNEVILSTKIAEGEDRVLSASIVDKSGTIMAPASRMNLKVSEPPSIEALKHDDTFIKDMGGDRVLVSEPIRIFSQEEGKNIVGAYAQVIYSLRGIGLSNAGITRIFLNAIIWTLLLGTIFYFLIVRITLKPLEALALDIENNASSGFKKLKRRFRFQALDEVMRKINSSIWQIKTGINSNDIDNENLEIEETGVADSNNFKALSNLSNSPTLLIKRDGTISDLNKAGEEFLNVAKDRVINQPLSSLFIDLGLMSTILDQINRISSTKDGPITEVISTQEGGSIKVTATPVPNSSGEVNNIIIQLIRED